MFHEDALALQKRSTLWYKTCLSWIYSIRTNFIAKYTLKNVHSYCEGACLSTDLTWNLAFWHHLIVSMEIDKFYAILWNISDKVVVNWVVVVRLALCDRKMSRFKEANVLEYFNLDLFIV